jgi:gamma-glutamylcyclotransferase (GGCT)/AIG2-like uncharacterized protein YtfP
MTTIFVYGTLKRGYGNWRNYLDNDGARFLGEAVSNANDYAMVNVGFPILCASVEDGAFVVGELFEVNDAVLAAVDKLEGHPKWYLRQPREFHNYRTGETVVADVYLQNENDFDGAIVDPIAGALEWFPGCGRPPEGEEVA